MIQRVSIGEDVKADKFNELVDALNRLRITGSGPIMVSGNIDSGFCVLMRRPGVAVSDEVVADKPKPFDIKSNAAGKIKIHRCWFKNGSKFIKTASEPEINIATGVLCALIDTAANPISVTLGFDVAFNTNTPEIFPVPLYDLTLSGTVATINADLRDCVAVYYE